MAFESKLGDVGAWTEEEGAWYFLLHSHPEVGCELACVEPPNAPAFDHDLFGWEVYGGLRRYDTVESGHAATLDEALRLSEAAMISYGVFNDV